MSDSPLQIGDLAKQTGLTVKTLRHYDEIGLLSPSARGANDYRLYDEKDIGKLQQITALKQLGLSLEEIKDTLAKPDYSPLATLEKHLGQVTEQMHGARELLERLDGMLRFMKTTGKTSTTEMLDAIRMMNEMESRYTPEQMTELRERARALGRDKIVAVENEWPELIAKMKKAMDDGKDPVDPEVQKLAKRWKELVDMFTGGNPKIEANLKKMYQEKPQASAQFGGPDPGMMEFVGKAIAAQK